MSRSRNRSERGAIIIHAAIALLGLTVFSAIVLDYGVLWSARRQSQNSADAGALAAAINMLYDPSATADAREAARRFAHANAVWAWVAFWSSPVVPPPEPPHPVARTTSPIPAITPVESRFPKFVTLNLLTGGLQHVCQTPTLATPRKEADNELQLGPRWIKRIPGASGDGFRCA